MSRRQRYKVGNTHLLQHPTTSDVPKNFAKFLSHFLTSHDPPPLPSFSAYFSKSQPIQNFSKAFLLIQNALFDFRF